LGYLLFKSLKTALEWKLANFWLLFVSVWRHDFGKIWQSCTYAAAAAAAAVVNTTEFMAL